MAGIPISDPQGRLMVNSYGMRPADGSVGTYGRTVEEYNAQNRLTASQGGVQLATSMGIGDGTFDYAYNQNMQIANNLEKMGYTAEANQQRAQYKGQRQEYINAQKDFFRIANEIDKMDQIPYNPMMTAGMAPGNRIMGRVSRTDAEGPASSTDFYANVAGPLEDIRRAEQKVKVYDQAARERRGRRTGLGASRGGGGGSSSSSVTGLSASGFRKTLLGG